MRLFGKRHEEEDEEENPRRKTFPSKGKRELTDKEKFFKGGKKSAAGRKKKFEIIPWTKKERLIVFGVLAGTMVLSGLLGMSAREWKLPNLPRIHLPKILGDETIVIEGKESGKEEREIVAEFESFTNSMSGVYGFFVIKMSDGNSFGVNEKDIFEAGSLNKLPVMLAMYRESELGNINLSTKYILKEGDKVAGSGSLASKPAGYVVSYEDLVRLMGKESDNTAFNIAKRVLGEEKILETAKNSGLGERLITENEATPNEIGYFWKNLLDLKISSRETRDALLEYMTGTIYEDWIAKDIPDRVSHKYGTLPHVRNDAGVVFADKPYILVVMSKGVIEKEADEVIPEISKMIYRRLGATDLGSQIKVGGFGHLLSSTRILAYSLFGTGWKPDETN